MSDPSLKHSLIYNWYDQKILAKDITVSLVYFPVDPGGAKP